MFSNLVALNVTDNDMYENYRREMKPILESYGGYFLYDFKIDEVLKSQVDHNINRVFVISFPNESSKDKFFTDENYLNVKRKYFVPSVDGAEIIASF